MALPLVPLVVGGTMLYAAGGTTGYVLGMKTEKLALYAGLAGAAYLAYRYGVK